MDKWIERTERNLKDLHPVLRDKLRLVLAELASEGITAFISYGGRTVAEQDKLYAQGRTRPGKRVTDARGGFSYHNYFVAADILCVDAQSNIIWDGDHHHYTRLGAIATKHDLAWGFLKNGKHWDKGHVNLRGFTIAQVRQMFQAGKLKQVWEAYGAYYDAKKKPVVRQVQLAAEPSTVVTIDQRSGKFDIPIQSGGGTVASLPEPKPKAVAVPDPSVSVGNEPLSPPFYDAWIKKVVSASIAGLTGSMAVVKSWFEKAHFNWRDAVILLLVIVIIHFWWKRNVRRVK